MTRSDSEHQPMAAAPRQMSGGDMTAPVKAVSAKAASVKAAPAASLSATDAESKASPSTTDDHDSPWKDALELYFPQALALLAPGSHAIIDWDVPVIFLDKELQAVKRASTPAQGRRHADKLVQVQLLDGDEAFLLVHVEVQGRLSGLQALQAFGWRMLEYKVLICQRERRKRQSALPPQVYSLGVLIDQPAGDDGQGSPATLTYSDQFLDQQTQFTFPIVELETWRSRWNELDRLAPANPFAVLIMAQLQAAGHPDKTSRLTPLIELHRSLYAYGYTRDSIGRLLRLVEWIVGLPPELETEYHLAARQLEQEHDMSYVTIAERYGMAKGLEQGLEQGLERGLEQGLERGLEQGLQRQANTLINQVQRRFGPLPDDITRRIQTASTSQLETWSLNFVDATSLEDVFRD